MVHHELPISYRLSKPEDLNFIFASWLSTAKNSAAGLSPNELFNTEQKHIIQYLLSNSQTMIAYLDSEADTILAYLTYQFHKDHFIIHQAFTKSVFRKQGIQSELINLTNIPKFPIILTIAPPKALLSHMQENLNIIYDHYYFTRKYFYDIHS